MCLARIIFLVLIIYSGNVSARMYQWTEPDTGTTQLSGKPPAWYRSINDGPRVFVFENGRLIDDTAVEVSDDVRVKMRQQAFILAEEDRQKAHEKLEKANELKAKYKPEPETKKTTIVEEENIISDDFEDYEQRQIESDAEQEDIDVDKLRELISEWEKEQTESARKSLE